MELTLYIKNQIYVKCQKIKQQQRVRTMEWKGEKNEIHIDTHRFAHASKWNTHEIRVYLLTFLVFFPGSLVSMSTVFFFSLFHVIYCISVNFRLFLPLRRLTTFSNGQRKNADVKYIAI